jgi:hypothetical protein
VSRSTNRLTWITDIEFLLLLEKRGIGLLHHVDSKRR